MDETNPVYENFRNKMTRMGRTPRETTRRISASKLLGRDLAAAIEINARKITILKNVIQAQQIQTGVMLASLSTPTEGIEKSVMALAYGDQITNMLQPFWALPLLAITGLKAKEILPYTLILFFIGTIIFISGLLLF